MMPSKLFLIEKEGKVTFKKRGASAWLFEVGSAGVLMADFLQLSEDLNVEVRLNGRGARCIINCGYLANKNNKLNININVLHKYKNTTSIQKIKGLATGESEVRFTGIIDIPQKSQKCDGRQNHRGVLLSPRAMICATPQLEIWADDVACTHGSAIGPLDPAQLFYLEARGLSEKEAQKLLLESFFSDTMPNDFRETIDQWMRKNV